MPAWQGSHIGPAWQDNNPDRAGAVREVTEREPIGVQMAQLIHATPRQSKGDAGLSLLGSYPEELAAAIFVVDLANFLNDGKDEVRTGPRPTDVRWRRKWRRRQRRVSMLK